MDRVFQDNLHSMLTWFLSPKSKGLELDGNHAVRMVAQNIALGYERLEFKNGPIQRTAIAVNGIENREYLNVDPEFLSPVLKLKTYVQNEIREFLIDFLIHGSLATLDYAKGWSDFDTYAIIKKKILLDVSAMVALREKFLYAYQYLLDIDKLQHHGFLICTGFDIAHYPPLYMPIPVIKLSKSLIGSQTITFGVIKTTDEEVRSFFNRIRFYKEVSSTGILKHHPYEGEYLLSDYRNAENGMYQFKYLLNNVTITPAYYYGALGEHANKREAIERIRSSLSRQSFDLLEKVTYVRSEWQNREAFPTKDNQIPQWIQDTIGGNYFQAVYDFMNDVGHLLEAGL